MCLCVYNQKVVMINYLKKMRVISIAITAIALALASPALATQSKLSHKKKTNAKAGRRRAKLALVTALFAGDATPAAGL